LSMQIWKFLSGCVTIQIEGLCLEGFLNKIRKFCRIYRVLRLRHTQMRICVKARYAERIFREAQEYRLDCSIVGRDRQIRFAEIFFRRWWILLSVTTVLIVVAWSCGFCRKIEITGNKRISEFAICELLEDHGISDGIRKRDIDLDYVEKLLYTEYPLAYAEVRFDGTALCIILQEGEEPPEITAENPCTVVSEKRGVIREISVGEGMAAVQRGEIVAEGSELILGAYRKKDMDFLVHARGKVIAQVEYFGTAEISRKNGLVRTGRIAEIKELSVGGMKICLRGNNPFELYEQEIIEKYYLPENMPAFIEIIDSVCYECERGISREMRETAAIQLREKAYFDALKQVPGDAKVVDFTSVISENNGKLKATATVTVYEDIGRNVPASFADIENTEETGET